MITIRHYSNMAEAGFAKSLLESVGIRAFLPDELTATLERPVFPMGIRLQVPEGDVDRALEALDSEAEFSPLPDAFEPPHHPEEALVEEAASPAATGETTRLSAFMRGGLCAWAVTFLVFVFAALTGGDAFINLGGLLMVFGAGGLVGLVLRAVYAKGRRDEAADRLRG